MHPHLHTKDNKNCEEVMSALEACNAQGFLHRSLGNCTEAKTAVNKCLRAERLERQRLNREAAKVRNEKMKNILQDIKDNS